jgi:hypothetical protein
MSFPRILFAVFACALALAAPQARASTTHWYYVVPGSCGVAPDGVSAAGTTDITTGAVDTSYYGNTSNISIICTLRLPQNATIIKARVWGDDPRSYGYGIQFSVKTLNYQTPGNPTTALSGHSAYGYNNYWWNQYANDTLTIDNENNAYVFNLYMSGGVGVVARLVELTYTLP